MLLSPLKKNINKYSFYEVITKLKLLRKQLIASVKKLNRRNIYFKKN